MSIDALIRRVRVSASTPLAMLSTLASKCSLRELELDVPLLAEVDLVLVALEDVPPDPEIGHRGDGEQDVRLVVEVPRHDVALDDDPVDRREHRHPGDVLRVVVGLQGLLAIVAQPFEQLVDLVAGHPVGRQLVAGDQVGEPALQLVVLGVGPDDLGDPTVLGQRLPGEQVFVVVHPLHVTGAAIILGQAKLGAPEFEQRVALLDRLPCRDEDLLDQGVVEPGPHLVQRILVVIGGAVDLEQDRLRLRLDLDDLETDGLPLLRRHFHQPIPGRFRLDRDGVRLGCRLARSDHVVLEVVDDLQALFLAENLVGAPPTPARTATKTRNLTGPGTLRPTGRLDEVAMLCE